MAALPLPLLSDALISFIFIRSLTQKSVSRYSTKIYLGPICFVVSATENRLNCTDNKNTMNSENMAEKYYTRIGKYLAGMILARIMGHKGLIHNCISMQR